MENDALNRINEFLLKHNASVHTISKVRLSQFIKVDAAIQERVVKIAEARDTLKGRPINLVVIANES